MRVLDWNKKKKKKKKRKKKINANEKENFQSMLFRYFLVRLLFYSKKIEKIFLKRTQIVDYEQRFFFLLCVLFIYHQ